MSFYRSILTAVAAITLMTPVFADDTNNTNALTDTNQTQTDNAKINLNTASAKELMTIKGIDAAKARAIVSYRTKNGDFKSIDELAKVKGLNKIESERMQEIQGQLSI